MEVIFYVFIFLVKATKFSEREGKPFSDKLVKIFGSYFFFTSRAPGNAAKGLSKLAGSSFLFQAPKIS